MTRPLTPEDIVYGMTPAGDPRVSPDGASILYTLTVTDHETGKVTTDLWRMGIDGSDRSPLTHSEPGIRAGSGRWSPDGRAIAFVRDDGTTRQVRVLPMHGGESRVVVTAKQPVGGLEWSPDGASLAYVAPVDPANPDGADRPEGAPPPVRVTRRYDYKQDNRGYLGDIRLQVHVVDVVSGTVRVLTRDAFDHVDPQWSPDGTTIAAKQTTHNGMHSQLSLVALATGVETLVGPTSGAIGVWAWSPGGDRILFAGDEFQTWQTDWFTHHPATGETRRLTHDLPVLPDAGYPTVVPPSQPIWLDDRRVLVNATRSGSSGLYETDAETGETTLVHDSRGTRSGLSVDASRRWVVQAASGMDMAGEIAVFDRETGTERIVTAYGSDLLAEAPAATWERLDVERGGWVTEAWLLFPPGFDPARRYPVILDVHGGPNGFYGYAFNATQQVLASSGFLVVYANPRGSGSYGRDFTQAVITDWGGEDYLDLMAVLDEVLARPYADRTRTGIYGYSYGGYMTAWAIGQSDRFAAAVCGAPCFDLESFYGTSDIGHVFGELQFGGQAHAIPEWYAAHSPSQFAHRVTTPTLIVHGEADDRCPIGQGEQMFVALAKAGCEVEFARYPGGSHMMLRNAPPAHRADYLGRVSGWFRDHLQPASETGTPVAARAVTAS